MTEERIDIVVNDKIQKSIRPTIVGIGSAARTASSHVQTLTGALAGLNAAGLKALTSNINANSLATLRQARATELSIKASNNSAIAAQRLTTATANASAAQSRAAQAALNLSNAQNRASQSTNTLSNNLIGLGGALGAYFSVATLGRTLDAYTTIQNKLQSITTSTAQLNLVQERLNELANNTRTDISSTTDAFVRFDKALRVTGAGQEEVLRFTETLNKALITAGRSTGEVNSIVIQLGQALTSGRLMGDEFRSLSENLPIEVLDAFAKELGVNRDQLKALSTEGKITAEVIRNAFANSAATIDAAFAKSVPTIEQSFVVLNNSFTDYLGKLDKAIGLSAGVSSAILFMADNMEAFAPVIAGLTTLIGVGLVGAVWALTAAMLANPLGLLVAGIVAAGVAIYNFRGVIVSGFNIALKGIEDFINKAIYLFKEFLNNLNGIMAGIDNAMIAIGGKAFLPRFNIGPDGPLQYVNFDQIGGGEGMSISDRVRGNTGGGLRPEGPGQVSGIADDGTTKLTEAQKALKSINDETIGAVRQLKLDQDALNLAYEAGWLGLDEYNSRMTSLGIKALELKMTMGDATFFDSITLGLAKVVEGFEGVLSGLTDSFGSFFTSVTDGFANSIGRAIVYGEDLGTALHNVAKSALSELISGLVKLGIQWVLMNTLGSSLQAAAGAASAAVAGGVAAAWAPAAALASLATGGTNAGPAAAALTGTTALASTLAAVGGVGFMKGGYTGDGPKNQVAGQVHSGEYVFDANATKAIGVDNLEAMRRNAKRPGNSNSGGVGSGLGGGVKIRVNNYGTPQDYEVQQITRDEIILIAKDQIRQDAPKVIAGDIANPNSRVSKSLSVNTKTQRNRS